jgi:L-aminopeptidase/D-esterase-like protein
MRPGPKNLITDVRGLRVGQVTDLALGSGVTAIVFDAPAITSVDIRGGAPGTRETDLLAPDKTVQAVDAIILSGGSAFGLDAAAGAMAALAALGRGFPVGSARVPIVPAAILFDLLNGGDKDWGRYPPYREMGYAAVEAASLDMTRGTVGAGTGATTATCKGGLGSASTVVGPYTVGAIVAVNAMGSATVGDTPHFLAAPYEINGEFDGLGMASLADYARPLAIKSLAPTNTTIALVATDATLTKAQARHLAAMAQDGLALALRPVHTPFDGDTVFAAATAQVPGEADLVVLGSVAATTLARAVARGIHAATPLPQPGALPAWSTLFANR